MFYLVSIGLKPKQLTLEALEIIRKCFKVYMEAYTSKFAEGSIAELERIIGKKVELLTRADVEENFDGILEESKSKNIALLVIGNALFATTHVQLLLDAKQKHIPFSFVPGISIQNYLGITGLSCYKFGEIASIVLPEKNYAPESFYDKIVENFKRGLHTLCLLDIKDEKPASVSNSLKRLLEIERKRETKIIKNACIIVLSGIASKNQKIFVGSAEKILKMSFKKPASIIICSKLNEKEKEALKVLYGWENEHRGRAQIQGSKI